MVRISSIYLVILVCMFAGISTVFLIREFIAVTSDGVPSAQVLMKSDDNQRYVLDEIELGSGAFYALPSTRKRLINDVHAVNNELQDVLSKTTEEEKSPGTVNRAIVGYLPAGSKWYETELKWLYLSIGNMRFSQPARAYQNGFDCLHRTIKRRKVGIRIQLPSFAKISFLRPGIMHSSSA